MGFRVNTNSASIAAQRRLYDVNARTEKTLSKLASGERIVRSADDPAGLAMSEKMKSFIKSRSRAERNANESIAMFQTAEGAIGTMQSMASRMRQLAIQSASDTYGSSRQFIEKEFAQIKNEMQRVAQTTQYNDIKIFSQEGKNFFYQVGIHNNQRADRLELKGDDIFTNNEVLGLTELSVSSAGSARDAIEPLKKVIGSLAQKRTVLGALHTRMLNVVHSAQIHNENESASNSRIRDADIAVESAEKARLDVVKTASVEGLHHANTFQAKSVLKLLT